MTPAQTISSHHQLLSSIAYKMLGTLADAEDVVQDTYLKWLAVDHTKIKNAKAYLVKSVTNNCLNHLDSLKRKKEEYLEHFHFDELVHARIDLDLSRFDVSQEVAAALSVVQKKLQPLEGAIFLLREVFDFDYEDIQHLFDKKKDNCRQIYCRAKEKLNQKTHDLKPEIISSNFLSSFKDACSIGVSTELINTFKQQIAAKLSF